MIPRSFTAAMLALMLGARGDAMTLKEFRKFSADEQSFYVGAAVSMVIYTYNANGNAAKARCVKT